MKASFLSLVVLATAVATSAMATSQPGKLSTEDEIKYKRGEEAQDYGKTDVVCDYYGPITHLQRATPALDGWCAYYKDKQLKNGETFQQDVVDGADTSISLTVTARCDLVLDKAWCQYMFKLPLSQCADGNGWTQAS